MKKLLALFLAFAMLLSMSACGGDSGSEEETALPGEGVYEDDIEAYLEDEADEDAKVKSIDVEKEKVKDEKLTVTCDVEFKANRKTYEGEFKLTYELDDGEWELKKCSADLDEIMEDEEDKPQPEYTVPTEATVATQAPEPETMAPTEPEPVESPVTLVYAEVNPRDSIVGRTAAYFAEQVYALSGGTVTVEVQYSGVLGSENDVLDLMLAGGDVVDMSRISAFALTSYGAQKSVLLSLPYTFVSREHFWNFANSDLAAEFLNEPQELGLPVRGVFFGEEGFRHFFTKEPIESIDDLTGLKLRVSNDPVMNGMVESLGASPTVISFAELYSALQSGVCDGAEQPIANYKSNAFQEVAPYMILDGHTIGAVQVVITDNAWNKLSENQQEAIMWAGKLAQAYNAEIAQAAEDEVLESLKAEGITIIDGVDKAALAEACAQVIADNTPYGLEDLYDQIVAMQ